MKQIDEGIAPVRAVRHEISNEFDHDVWRYLAYLLDQESSKYAQQVKAYGKSHPLQKRGKATRGRRTAVSR